jgi:hypothetical protein
LSQLELSQQQDALTIAFTYYNVYKNDFPNSKHADVVSKRIRALLSSSSYNHILQNLFENYFAEASIVRNNILFANHFFQVNIPNPLYFFYESSSENSSLQILDRYYDDIIVNYPEFEMYGYYWKIIANLSIFEEVKFINDGLLKFDVKKINMYHDKYYKRYSTEFPNHKKKLDAWLLYLTQKYPNHSVTLELNLIFAKLFFKKNGDSYDLETKSRIEFIVQNELDKTHPRYMLAKEFLLNNKFE